MLNRLVLWDIDGTLTVSGGVSTQALAIAFERATGQPMQVSVDTHGQTDRTIFSRVLAANRASGDFDVFAKAEAAAYQELAGELLVRGRVLPGVVDVLTRLAAMATVVQGPVTGNNRECAAINLDAFGLLSYLNTEVGAYGDDDAHRPNLVSIAWERVAQRYGRVFDPQDLVIVGDTPHDIDAAKTHGARAVAVATGHYDAATLRHAGADVVFQDLFHTESVLHAILE